MSKQTSALTTAWLALVLIILDQLTKYWVNAALVFGEPVAVMPHLNFTLVYNQGAAFSFLADMGGWQRWGFSALAIVVSAVLVYWLKTLPKRWTMEVVGINLVLGGALGNVIDRLIEGHVTDFIDFYIGSWHYATFNVADIAISAGAFCLIVSEFFLKPKKASTLDSASESD
ncbi:MAG: signal peptidase II [Hydrogenovibrio sp.]|nr:signal peptidase II [Hydrogenovibrio sp.]